MTRRALAFLPLIFLAACQEPPSEPTLVLIGATLYSGTGSAVPVKNAVVVIQRGRLRAVGPQMYTAIPAGSVKEDLTGRFIINIPGERPVLKSNPATLLVLAEDPIRNPRAIESPLRVMRGGVWEK